MFTQKLEFSILSVYCYLFIYFFVKQGEEGEFGLIGVDGEQVIFYA